MIANALRILRHKGVTGFLTAIYFLAKGNLYRHLLGRRIIEKKVYDYRMYLDLDDMGISRTLLLFGAREAEHMVILKRVLWPGMTVLDIGANIGYYVLMECQLVGPSGRIVAVEPAPNNLALLRRNIALNGCQNVTVLPKAISDTASRRTFYLSKMSNLSTFHPEGSGELHLSGEVLEVETETVVGIMARLGRPDLIRMDVEGHEVEIVTGMLEAIERGEMAPMILFETHLSRYGCDHDFEGPLRRLFACGYGVRFLASSSASGTKKIDARGYKGSQPIETDFLTRVIYEDVDHADAIDFICRIGGARTVLLQKMRADLGQQ